jgi:streptogramin lyase
MMNNKNYRKVLLRLTAAAAMAPMLAFAQPGMAPVNDLPNPYQTIEGWAKMPEGRSWGSTSAVDIDKDGISIWVGERCGGNVGACVQNADVDPIMKFDENGNMVKSFGAGLITWPHGIHVDPEGNIWITDARDNRPQGGGEPEHLMGHQILKFSPEGELLLELGEPGGARAPGYFFQPNDVLVAPNGNIFAVEGHSNAPDAPARVTKFNAQGEFIGEWGTNGNGPGQFLQPHSLAMDSQGRLFVADRSNNRIQIFDQEGTLLDTWHQFSRNSGLYIDANDVLYAADSESGSVAPDNAAWLRGIRVGSARTGEVHYLIPDPNPECRGTCTAEGVVADRNGVIYGAEVGPVGGIKRYLRQ